MSVISDALDRFFLPHRNSEVRNENAICPNAPGGRLKPFQVQARYIVIVPLKGHSAHRRTPVSHCSNRIGLKFAEPFASIAPVLLKSFCRWNGTPRTVLGARGGGGFLFYSWGTTQ